MITDLSIPTVHTSFFFILVNNLNKTFAQKGDKGKTIFFDTQNK
jgi:hypothetical protein